jgi:hypothetical protein
MSKKARRKIGLERWAHEQRIQQIGVMVMVTLVTVFCCVLLYVDAVNRMRL